MYLKRLLSELIWISLLVLFPTEGQSDGSFFFEFEIEQLGSSAESPNQRAFILHDGQLETLVLQVKYSGNVEDFAWVVPLPSLPEENTITTVSDSIFEELHDETQPRIYRLRDPSESWLGGGGDFGEPPREAKLGAEVQIWEKLDVGPYEVLVLSGSSSQALIDWLNSNGFHFPDKANTVIDFYIQKQWYFLATRVQLQVMSQGSNSTYQAGLPALKVTFPVDQPVYPLRISELTSAKENEIELYVAAHHRMVCESYQTIAMNRDEVQSQLEEQFHSGQGSPPSISCACKELVSPTETNPQYDYDTIFRDKLAFSGSPTFLVESAHLYQTYDPSDYPIDIIHKYLSDHFDPATIVWITRFRTILPPSSMQTDVLFVPDPEGDNTLHLDIFIEEKAGNPWSATVFSFPGILLLPLLSFRRIRKRYRRHLMLAILLITIATV